MRPAGSGLWRTCLFGAVVGAAAAAAPASEVLEGRWAGTMEVGGRSMPVSGWIETRLSNCRATLSIPDLVATDFDFDATPGEGGRLTATHKFRVGAITLEGTQDGASWSGRWLWGKNNGPFALHRVGDLPPAYRKEPVDFASAGIHLVGTLVVPSGEGPFPAVVWVHDGGAVTRDSQVYTLGAFLLAEHGVASLIYDKRGSGLSEGNFRTALPEDLAADALAGARFLRTRGEIDGSRVGIGGFGEGATAVLPSAFALGGDFAFAVAVGPSGEAPAAQRRYAAERRLEMLGVGDEERVKALSLLDRVHAVWLTDAPDECLDADLAAHTHETWFRVTRLPVPPVVEPTPEFRAALAVDPAELWRSVKSPVLLVWGSADAEANPARAREALGAALEKAGNGDVEMRVFEGADDDLLMRPTPGTGGVTTLAPGVTGVMVEWVGGVVGE